MAWNYHDKTLVYCVTIDGNLTAGSSKTYFHLPCNAKLAEVSARVGTVGGGSGTTGIGVADSGGTTILGTLAIAYNASPAVNYTATMTEDDVTSGWGTITVHTVPGTVSADLFMTLLFIGKQ